MEENTLKFSLWLESKMIRDAVIGAISPNADDDERQDILAKKTTFFGSEVRKNIKNLGIVKNSGSEVLKSIDDGIKIGELIKMLEG